MFGGFSLGSFVKSASLKRNHPLQWVHRSLKVAERRSQGRYRSPRTDGHHPVTEISGVQSQAALLTRST